MDQSYLGSRQRKWPIHLFVLIGIILVVAGVIFFFSRNKKELISPIPKQPSFEVIFTTPTPGQATPTSTPSATPKVKATVVPSPKPTKAVTPSPSTSLGTSPTGKTTPSPTVKPSPTVTL